MSSFSHFLLSLASLLPFSVVAFEALKIERESFEKSSCCDVFSLFVLLQQIAGFEERAIYLHDNLVP